MNRHMVTMAMTFLVLLYSGSCKPDEMGDIELTPAHIVAGTSDVTVQVRGTAIPAGARIRIAGKTYSTRTLSPYLLTCSLPREDTLPQNPLAGKWTLSVDLVGQTGELLSRTADLTIMRDYVWSRAEKITDRGADQEMAVHLLGNGSLFLLFRSGCDILRIVSDDAGEVWHDPEILFTLAQADQAHELVVRNQIVLIFLEEEGALVRYELNADQTLSAAHTVLAAGQCGRFRVLGDSEGVIHLLWDDPLEEGPVRLRYSRSRDGGINWSEPSVVAGEGEIQDVYLGISGLCAFAGGHVFAAYEENTGRYSLEHGRISHDGGMNWHEGSPLDARRSLFCGNGRVLKFERSMYLPYLYHARISLSEDWGESWQRVLHRDDDLYQRVDWMAADSQGNLLASLCQSEWPVKNLIRSLDRGLTWLIPDTALADLPLLEDVTTACFTSEGALLLFSSSGISDGIQLRRAYSFY